MDVMTIFAIQFIMSLVVWGSLAYWLLTPWLEKKSLNEALFFLTVPHAFRHIGMVFLVPGVVAGPLSEQLVSGTGGRLALQHRRHYRPYKCAPTGGCVDDKFRSNLVHSDNVGTAVVGDSDHDIFSTVQRGGQVQHSRLTDKRITRLLQRTAKSRGR
jgi:hypothetical protein